MQYPQPASTSWRSDSAGNVTVKSAAEQESMRVAGRLASQVLDMIGQHVVPGVSTEELDRICHDYIVNVQDAIPAPLGYRGYPKSICTSVNHVVCHGIPGDRRLKQGDFVNIDVTVIKDGWHGDNSRMYVVGEGGIAAARVAVGACSPVAVRLADLERALVGARWSEAPALVEARHLAPLAAIDDVRATAAYRREAVLELVRRVLAECIGEAMP